MLGNSYPSILREAATTYEHIALRDHDAGATRTACQRKATHLRNLAASLELLYKQGNLPEELWLLKE